MDMTRYGPGKSETLKVENSSPPVSCLSIFSCFPGPVPFTLTVVSGEPIALFDQRPKVPQMVRLPAAKPPRLSSERCYIYTYYLHPHTTTTTTQCKLLEHKWSMCTSGWKEKTTSASCNACHHHWCKECLHQWLKEKHHQHKLQIVTTTMCAG